MITYYIKQYQQLGAVINGIEYTYYGVSEFMYRKLKRIRNKGRLFATLKGYKYEKLT